MIRRFAIFLLFGLGISTAACSNAPSAGAHRSANFGFFFLDRPCGKANVDVLDTTKGTLTHTPLGETTSTTIPFTLTDAELDRIYDEIVAIDFFSYPMNFVVPNRYVRGFHSPAASYHLSVTNGIVTNKVDWTDEVIADSAFTRADRLRDLMTLIQGIIENHVEYQRLPKQTSFCA